MQAATSVLRWGQLFNSRAMNNCAFSGDNGEPAFPSSRLGPAYCGGHEPGKSPICSSGEKLKDTTNESRKRPAESGGVCARRCFVCVCVCKSEGQEYSIIALPLKIKNARCSWGPAGIHRTLCVSAVISFAGDCTKPRHEVIHVSAVVGSQCRVAEIKGVSQKKNFFSHEHK